jgi:hypothetical protein
MPKTLCERKYRTQFLPWLRVPTENIWVGGVRGSSFLNSLHAILGVVQK